MPGDRFYVRVDRLPTGDLMVAVTDEELVGKRLVDEERGIVLDIDRSYYGVKLVDRSEALKLIDEANIVVLTGPRALDLGASRGLVNPDAVLWVKGCPHVQIFKFMY